MIREWLPQASGFKYQTEFNVPSYSEFCDLLDGKAKPKQTKEEMAVEMNGKIDAMLSKYQRRR
jgi:hypothetical protein